MPKLEISYPDGNTDSQRLSRRNPIVIGRNPISDIHIDDASIAAIHCRVLWNGEQFEIAATADEGVDVNGTLVKRKALAVGDVIRVGEADMTVISSRQRRKEREREKQRRAVGASSVKEESPEQDDGASLRTQELSEEDWGALAGADDDAEPIEFAEAPPPAADEEVDEEDDDAVDEAEQPAEQPPSEKEFRAEPEILDEKPDRSEKDSPKQPSPAARPSWSRLPSRKRPGEQDILTSPVVLGLGGLALALLLAAGAIWFLIGRENANRRYEAAMADRQAGKYTQAIAGFEKFLLDYPTDDRTREVQVALGMSRIERHVRGTSPDFEKALAAFDQFVRDFRDADDFDALTPALASTAQTIASGASAAAIRTGDRAYLAPAEEAGQLYSRYSGEGPQVQETAARLESDFSRAETAVRKQEYFDEILTRVESAIEENAFLDAYQARADLLARYPDFRENQRMSRLLDEALGSERALVHPLEEADITAKTLDTAESAGNESVMVFGHTQARVGETSDGRLIIAMAGDQLVGLDVVTGKPQWRTTVGAGPPFFPMEVEASVPALLAFDSAGQNLMMIARETGKLLWRTHIGRPAAGPPRIAQGQIDLATTDGHLVRLALETGEPLASVSFPQPLAGTPVPTSDGEHLILFGEQATAYVLDFRSLEIRGSSFIGHPPGSLATSPRRLGKLVVMFENDRLESAAVRALAFDPASTSLSTVAAERVEGTIHMPPMPRGNVLFVPSSMERVTAFSVSDDPGQPPLTRLAGVQITNPRDVATYLVPGPDGIVWAAGSALRKLKLVAEELNILPGELAAGRHRQPVQESGESLFVARTLPATRAIYVSQADRDSMTGSWRTVLGADIIAQASANQEITLATAAGQVAVVRNDDLKQKQFLKSSPLPEWDEMANAPLRGTSLGDGNAFVWRDGDPPLLWRINPNTSVAPPEKLPAAPQTAPVALPGGLVLPTSGRLVWHPAAGGSAVDPFLLPVTEGSDPPTWQSLTALDETTLAALTADGTLRVIRRRAEPRPHLAEVATADLASATNRPLAALEGRIVAAIGNRLQTRDPAGLRPVAEHEFPTPIQGGPWVAGSQIFVRLDSGTVLALDGQTLEPRWKTQTPSPLADAPTRRDSDSESSPWILACQDGTVVIVGPDRTENARISLPMRLAGLTRLAGRPAALSAGGIVVAIEANEPSAPATAKAASSPNGEEQ